MKKQLAVIMIAASVLLSSGCSKVVKPDTPFNAVFLMQNAIDNQDYEKFQKMMIESKRDVYTIEDLKGLKELGATGGGSLFNYYICEYPNGEMVMFELTPGDIDGKYFIQDIITVPKEQQKLFEGRTGKK